MNSDAQINPEFLLNILDQYSKDHNAILVEEVSTKLGKAFKQDNEKITNLTDEVSQLKSLLAQKDKEIGQLTIDLNAQKEQKQKLQRVLNE